jgi:hypothetical protein
VAKGSGTTVQEINALLSQFREGSTHPIKGRISLFVVTAFCATTMLSGVSNVAVFRIHHNSLQFH